MTGGFVWKSTGTVDKFISHTDVSLTFGWCQVSIYQPYCYGLIRSDTQKVFLRDCHLLLNLCSAYEGQFSLNWPHWKIRLF